MAEIANTTFIYTRQGVSTFSQKNTNKIFRIKKHKNPIINLNKTYLKNG